MTIAITYTEADMEQIRRQAVDFLGCLRAYYRAIMPGGWAVTWHHRRLDWRRIELADKYRGKAAACNSAAQRRRWLARARKHERRA